MGILDDAENDAHLRYGSEVAAREFADQRDQALLSEFIDEFLRAVVGRGIAPRPIYVRRLHTKRGFFITQNWATTDPVGYGWLVSISFSSGERGGTYAHGPTVIMTDGRALWSSDVEGKPDTVPGLTEPLVGSPEWQPVHLNNVSSLVRCGGEYLAAAAVGRRIR